MTSVDGCCIYIIIHKIYCMVPGVKGQHANPAGQHQKKKQQNIAKPAGISNPIAIT